VAEANTMVSNYVLYIIIYDMGDVGAWRKSLEGGKWAKAFGGRKRVLVSRLGLKF
jgi:hypothetical protein